MTDKIDHQKVDRSLRQVLEELDSTGEVSAATMQQVVSKCSRKEGALLVSKIDAATAKHVRRQRESALNVRMLKISLASSVVEVLLGQRDAEAVSNLLSKRTHDLTIHHAPERLADIIGEVTALVLRHKGTIRLPPRLSRALEGRPPRQR